MPRTTKKAAAPAPIGPDLTVSAVVTVICTPDGGAYIHLEVGMEGRESLVAAMNPAQGKCKIAGAALRRIVQEALKAEPEGPVVDLLEQRRTAGRA